MRYFLVKNNWEKALPVPYEVTAVEQWGGDVTVRVDDLSEVVFRNVTGMWVGVKVCVAGTMFEAEFGKSVMTHGGDLTVTFDETGIAEAERRMGFLT